MLGGRVGVELQSQANVSEADRNVLRHAKRSPEIQIPFRPAATVKTKTLLAGVVLFVATVAVAPGGAQSPSPGSARCTASAL